MDDQTDKSIAQEAEAFLEIISAAEKGEVLILGSDLLKLEVSLIQNPLKRTESQQNLRICKRSVEESEEILDIAEQLESHCKIGGRDALHIASAVVGEAIEFVTCDYVLLKKAGRIKEILRTLNKKILFKNPIELVKNL